MESLRFTRLRHLAEAGPFPVALTAYLPIPDETAFPPDPKKLGKIQEKVEKALAKGIDIKEAENFRTNLDLVLDILSETKHLVARGSLRLPPLSQRPYSCRFCLRRA
jgi:hypothetical protein